MFNWNVDEERFKKEDPKGYRLWRLTQLINYGLSEGEKLDKKEVIKAWPMIKENIDPYTPKQNQFLGYIQAESEINKWFYLTGGTALSEFYLKHRLSEDIDLFSHSQVNDIFIDGFLKKISPKLRISNIKKDHIMGLFIYKLVYSDGESLKIDFNEFEFPQVELNNVKLGNLAVDSFYDIAINKLYTILGRFQTRDFIDLYFILKKKEFILEQLISRTEEKFNTKVDMLYLSSQLLRVVDLPKSFPKMLKPFKFGKMVDYFKKEAKRLGEKGML
ncbi:nucleotidyl transferase AbiEii/AbiGii toxin family protein [Candidatus Gottesmanbacteria bacterium]|nr:nucleotidyl transferase AbiEii/AbiGii toxin family protein [Candidatus Gottesmanbacteria bacterium]